MRSQHADVEMIFFFLGGELLFIPGIIFAGATVGCSLLIKKWNSRNDGLFLLITWFLTVLALGFGLATIYFFALAIQEFSYRFSDHLLQIFLRIFL